MWRLLAFGALALAWLPSVWAFSAAGHQAVGRLAESLVEGTRAGDEVRAILGATERLPQAGVWLDCARNVRPNQGFAYSATHLGEDRACGVYAEPGVALDDLVAYVRRNHDNCEYSGRREGCHRSYHFTNVPIQLGRYDPQSVGANPADIVQAIRAATTFLRDGTRREPFRFGEGAQGRREALRMLAHLVADLHQPLHVGSLYLSPQGRPTNPNRTAKFKGESDNFGGNLLRVGTTNLHSMWDGISDELRSENLSAEAGSVLASEGGPDAWPTQWASESIQVARTALRNLHIEPKGLGGWPVRLKEPEAYERQMREIQRSQVIKAGARLAELLQAIWPD